MRTRITAPQKQNELDLAADQYWRYRKAGNEAAAKVTWDHIGQLVELQVLRGNEPEKFVALCSVLGLDYLAPGEAFGCNGPAHTHRWVGNIGELDFADGYEFLLSWHEAGATTAQAVADVEGDLPYQFSRLPVTINGHKYWVSYCEGDVQIEEPGQ